MAVYKPFMENLICDFLYYINKIIYKLQTIEYSWQKPDVQKKYYVPIFNSSAC